LIPPSGKTTWGTDFISGGKADRVKPLATRAAPSSPWGLGTTEQGGAHSAQRPSLNFLFRVSSGGRESKAHCSQTWVRGARKNSLALQPQRLKSKTQLSANFEPGAAPRATSSLSDQTNARQRTVQRGQRNKRSQSRFLLNGGQCRVLYRHRLSLSQNSKWPVRDGGGHGLFDRNSKSLLVFCPPIVPNFPPGSQEEQRRLLIGPGTEQQGGPGEHGLSYMDGASSCLRAWLSSDFSTGGMGSNPVTGEAEAAHRCVHAFPVRANFPDEAASALQTIIRRGPEPALWARLLQAHLQPPPHTGHARILPANERFAAPGSFFPQQGDGAKSNGYSKSQQQPDSQFVTSGPNANSKSLIVLVWQAVKQMTSKSNLAKVAYPATGGGRRQRPGRVSNILRSLGIEGFFSGFKRRTPTRRNCAIEENDGKPSWPDSGSLRGPVFGIHWQVAGPPLQKRGPREKP